MTIEAPGQQAEFVQLDPRETFIIQTHANVRQTAAMRLETEENIAIQNLRQQFHDIMKSGGDAARVALMLFTLEFDNTQPPYGETFKEMEQVPFDDAVKMWQEGYKTGEVTVE